MSDRRAQAVNLFNQGVMRAQEGDKAFAYKLLNSAADIDPTFHEAWFQVGNANGDMKLLHGAIACFRRAIEIDPQPKYMVNLGHRLYHAGKNDEARKWTERAVELDPTLAFGWTNLSLIEATDGNNKKSLSLAKKAFEMQKDPIIECALAFAYLFSGDYANGLRAFESRFSYKLPEFNKYPYPKWKGEDLSHSTIFIQAEQGVGDTWCYSRFFPAIAEKAEKIIVGCQPELVRVFQAQFLEWPNIEILALPCPFPPADYWTTPTSLPVPLGLTNDEIVEAPWLPIPPFSGPAPWLNTETFNIAICWAGSSLNDIEPYRRVPLELFLELYKVPGIQLYSLQVGDNSQDISKIGAGALVKDMFPYIRDLGDTISILKHMDLVITVETFLGWICAALQKETWVAYSWHGRDYRFGWNPGKVMWADQHRVFKQGKDARWEPVFERIVEALLKERVNGDVLQRN